MYGERIKELREELQLSQMKLAKRTGITQSAIARYELEITEPRVSEIIKLCNFFNCTSDYIIGLEENYPNKKAVVYNHSTHNGNNHF